MQNEPASGAPLDRGVRPLAQEWQHLKPYGYAPGHYMNKCHNCEQVVTGVDKRAHTCRPCAEALHEQWSKPPCMQCGAKTEEEAGRMCRCAGDNDDCHGTRLWPEA